jgi:hypothetical protein
VSSHLRKRYMLGLMGPLNESVNQSVEGSWTTRPLLIVLQASIITLCKDFVGTPDIPDPERGDEVCRHVSMLCSALSLPKV